MSFETQNSIFFSALIKLKILTIYTSKDKTISNISLLTNLQNFTLSNSTNLENIDFIYSLTNITYLNITTLPDATIIDIEKLLSTTNLNTLLLEECVATNIPFISIFTKLQELRLPTVDIKNIPISLTHFHYTQEVNNFELITNLTNLEKIDIYDKKIDVNTLRILFNLPKIDIVGSKMSHINKTDLKLLKGLLENNKELYKIKSYIEMLSLGLLSL